MKVILASKSPRRKELMNLLGIEYEIMVSQADETIEQGLSLEEQSKKLGYIKAKAVFDKTAGDRIVIGSDTLVVKGDKLFGKPKDKQDAINMLNELKNDKELEKLKLQEQESRKQRASKISDIIKKCEEIEDIDLKNIYRQSNHFSEMASLTHLIRIVNKYFNIVIKDKVMIV